MNKPTKAVIAVAGYGTRRLPVAKAVEKCMLPLLNRPVVDYIVQDVIKAGVTDIYFVVSGGARQLREYYSRNMELEAYLKTKGKVDLLDAITPPDSVTFHYIEQDTNDARYGTTIPLWLSRDYIAADEWFYLIMGDQTLWRADGDSECELLYGVAQNAGANGGLIGVEVPWEQVDRFGVIDTTENGAYKRIVEHPKLGEAPSNLNNASIYLLPGTIMAYAEAQMASKHVGEYFVIDVLNEFVQSGGTLAVRRTNAEYLDCGSVDNWVRSNTFLLEQLSGPDAATL